MILNFSSLENLTLSKVSQTFEYPNVKLWSINNPNLSPQPIPNPVSSQNTKSLFFSVQKYVFVSLF